MEKFGELLAKPEEIINMTGKLLVETNDSIKINKDIANEKEYIVKYYRYKVNSNNEIR
jgi:hypothetical protein